MTGTYIIYWVWMEVKIEVDDSPIKDPKSSEPFQIARLFGNLLYRN